MLELLYAGFTIFVILGWISFCINHKYLYKEKKTKQQKELPGFFVFALYVQMVLYCRSSVFGSGPRGLGLLFTPLPSPSEDFVVTLHKLP